MTPQDKISAPETGKNAFPVGAVVFAVLLIGAFILYALDTAGKSRGLTDWVMIVPVAAIGVIALLIGLFQDIRNRGTGNPAEDAFPAAGEAIETRQKSPVQPVIFMAILVAYVGSLPWLGFDVGTMLFIVASLALQGERRWWVFATVAVGGALLLSVLFRYALMVRIPLLLF